MRFAFLPDRANPEERRKQARTAGELALADAGLSRRERRELLALLATIQRQADRKTKAVVRRFVANQIGN